MPNISLIAAAYWLRLLEQDGLEADLPMKYLTIAKELYANAL